MEIRPRLTPEEYQAILDYRAGLLQYKQSAKVNTSKSKIFLFDVETSPISAYIWSLWKQNVNTEFVNSDWFMLSWAGKFLGEDTIYSDVVTAKESIVEDDKRIIKSLWDMVDQSDILIGHNLIKFDSKKMNTRFLYHGFPPPSHYEMIDTLAELRKTFAITSNRLNYVNTWLGLQGKIPTNASLWASCLRGDEESLRLMKEYNENDVLILESNYLKIRGWIKNHPNINMLSDNDDVRCPNCGSEHLTWGGYKTTKVGRYQAYRCDDCGHVGHSRFSDLSLDKRKSIVR